MHIQEDKPNIRNAYMHDDYNMHISVTCI